MKRGSKNQIFSTLTKFQTLAKLLKTGVETHARVSLLLKNN